MALFLAHDPDKINCPPFGGTGFLICKAVQRSGNGWDIFFPSSFLFPPCLERVKYLQTTDCQLFKKIQLAFDHVRIPLKSELFFSKHLIINDLVKFNSLQTYVRPGNLHLHARKTCIAGEGTAGQSMKGEKPRRRVGIRFYRHIFPPHSQPLLSQLIDIQRFVEIAPALGYLVKYPNPALFCKLLTISGSRKESWLWGGK